MRTLILDPAATAFLEVGTFVAVMVAGFGLLQWRTGGGPARWLASHPRIGPLAGAALGALPGCGGAIVVMPLYLRGTVSFGTVVAALVATMGDASFVLLATEPATALVLHLGLAAAGAITGALTDAVRLGPTPRAPAPLAANRGPSTVGAAAATIGLLGQPTARTVSAGLVAFWSLVAIGLALAIPTVFHLVDPDALVVLGVPTVTVVGVAGLAACLAIVIRGGRPRHLACAPAGRPRDVLLDAARETALVTVWVAVAFVGTEVVLATTPLELSRLPTLGLVGVVIGAGLGLLPGCGPQVLLTGLYAQGLVPLPMLVANALSQDGDALLPLLAMDRRAALAGSAVSTVPGLLIGGGMVVLGW